MRILLLGANGQVGHALRSTLPALGEVVHATRAGTLDGAACESADLLQPATLAALVERVSPDVVVNAAAYTAVDRAEDEPAAAHAVNAEAPGALAAACAARGARLVHYSTDYVFDGSASRPYREDDPTAPLGVYGASKLAGEQAIRASGCRHLILRTAWVYGLHGHNFLRTMLRLAAERDELRVVDDQVGTPTSAPLIAEVTARALLQWAGEPARPLLGTAHLTASGTASWCGFAREIVAVAQRGGRLQRVPAVTAIATADFPTRARRPAYSVMDTSRLRAALACDIPDWRDDLAGVLGREPAIR